MSSESRPGPLGLAGQKMKFYGWFLVKTAILLGSALTVAILTPHMIGGHLFLSDKAAQSVVLFLDFILAFFFFGIYYRDVTKLNQKVEKAEYHLEDTFRYIGKANVTIELLSDFILIPNSGAGAPSGRSLLKGLLKKLLVSVLKSKKGLLRFIDRSSRRSLTELTHQEQNGGEPLTLPNSIVDDADPRAVISLGEHQALISLIPHQDRVCVLMYTPASSDVDTRLARVLLNQIHLLFLVMEKN